jgi:hypothetical protein
MTMKAMMMMPKMHEANDYDANMPMKVPFVMTPISKRTTAMRSTMITHLPMPLLLLALQ